MPKATVIRRKHANLPAALPRGRATVKVGVIGGENAAKAAYNEFGTKDIPERPFVRTTMQENRGAYGAQLTRSAKGVLLGSMSMDQALGQLGAKVQGDIQETITAVSTPPNAPSTIAQKGSSNPLIDTGEMRQAVTWERDD